MWLSKNKVFLLLILTPTFSAFADFRAPDENETFSVIESQVLKLGIKKSQFDFNESLLNRFPDGNSKKINGWMSGNYYPLALGGFAVKPGAFAQFLSIIQDKLDQYRKDSKRPTLAWSQYCKENPDACSVGMFMACAGEENSPDLSTTDKLSKLFEAQGLTTKIAVLTDHEHCNLSSQWWYGSCDMVGLAESLFPNAPKAKTVAGVALSTSDLEVITHLLLKEVEMKMKFNFIGHRNMSTGIFGTPATQADIDDLNPASLLVALANTYGKHRGEYVFFADRDESKEVWNEVVTSYHINSVKEVSRDEVDKLYAIQKRDRSAGVKLADSAIRFKRVKFSILYSKDIRKNFDSIIEIGAQGRVVGGEWLQNDHPDFLWSLQSKESQIMQEIQKRPDLKFMLRLITDRT